MQQSKHVKWRIVKGVFALGLIFGTVSIYFNVARTASIPPGISTPTSFIITLKEAALQLSIHREFDRIISQEPASLDIISNTGKATALFSEGAVNFNTYHGVRLTLDSTAKFSGINPCTGDQVTDVPVQLPGSENNEYIMRYEVPHPVLGLPQDAKPFQEYVINADNVADPAEFRMVFPVSNSIACISDTPFNRQILGSNSGINSAYSINIDSVNNEIAVSNNGADSVSIFQRTDSGDTLPLRTIQGTSTELNAPWGLAVYHDPLDPSLDEIYVANSNDTITVYHRMDIGDVTPLRKIQGAASNLNGPGAIYVDSVHDEIGVANGGPNANSINIYDRLADVGTSVTPLSTIEGPDTGLDTPCGISYDSTNDEIIVGNNGNNSITIYSRLDSGGILNQGNVAPIRTIKGNKTGLANVCNVYADSKNGEIVAVNNTANTVTFYNRLADGNEFPIRTIKGPGTGLAAPFGLSIDETNDEVAVTNLADDSIIYHPRADGTPHPLRAPVLNYPNIEQSLYASYVFAGELDKITGEPLVDNQVISWDPDAQGKPVPRFRGYGINWKVYNTELRQPNDATNATLIPPKNLGFTLTDGSTASNLQIGCVQFTPFYLDILTTNCKTQPPIISPSPPVNENYTVAASLLGKTVVQKLPLTIPSLDLPELPRLKPHITMTNNRSILSISWEYVKADNTPIPSPLLYSQSFSINANQAFDAVSSCYKLIGGNATTLMFTSGALPADMRSYSNVKNNNCDINLDDIATISFTATDALGSQYVYSWTPQ